MNRANTVLCSVIFLLMKEIHEVLPKIKLWNWKSEHIQACTHC